MFGPASVLKWSPSEPSRPGNALEGFMADKRRSLPPHHFVRAAETLGHALVMREVVDDGPDRELALRMKGGLEFARREQESIDAPQS
jgi:hypothetical protein